MRRMDKETTCLQTSHTLTSDEGGKRCMFVSTPAGPWAVANMIICSEEKDVAVEGDPLRYWEGVSEGAKTEKENRGQSQVVAPFLFPVRMSLGDNKPTRTFLQQCRTDSSISSVALGRNPLSIRYALL